MSILKLNKKATLITSLIFMMLLNSIAQKSNTISDPETFAKNFFYSLSTNRIMDMEKYFPSFLDVYEIFDVQNIENDSTSDQKRTETNRAMLKYQEETIIGFRKDYDSLMVAINKYGINLKTSALIKVDYTITKRDNMLKGLIVIHFMYNSKSYIISLKDCINTSSGWTIGNNFILSEAKKD